MMSTPLLEIEGLKKYFPQKGLFTRKGGVVRAVDGVSFEINKGETFGLVGESGCGKSTTGKLALRLLEPTAGRVHFEGHNLFELGQKELRHLRRRMQVIFQDPSASLNPRMTAGEIIGEPLVIHNLLPKDRRAKRVGELMEMVGLSPMQAARYPHEFSGGQKQRIGIARALSVDPVFIVADEAVSSLDVSIRAQILNLLQDLQQHLGLTYLFITHDLSVVKHLSDRLAVMYMGQIVELGATASIFNHPRHPYTQALLLAIPVTNPDVKRKRIILGGEIPSPINPPTGCRFHTRCPCRTAQCTRSEPQLVDTGAGHLMRCCL